MIHIAKLDWDRVHECACEIANASGQDDAILSASRTAELFSILEELEKKYGPCSRITATMADYTDENPEPLYQKALRQARVEGDTENEALIMESIREL